jgi:hypothetical protein
MPCAIALMPQSIYTVLRFCKVNGLFGPSKRWPTRDWVLYWKRWRPCECQLIQLIRS